jgi:sugar/nucleoside kinase (ribokinase family)
MAEVTLTVVGDELEAEMLCGMLRANGVECSHRRTDPASAIAVYAVGNSIAGPTEVIVNEEDLERARRLLPR